MHKNDELSKMCKLFDETGKEINLDLKSVIQTDLKSIDLICNISWEYSYWPECGDGLMLFIHYLELLSRCSGIASRTNP